MFRMEFSIIALIGVFLLIGIVKKNAILIIDFALEAERARGLTRRRGGARGLPAALPPDPDDHAGRRARRAAAGDRLRRGLGAAPAAGRRDHRRADRQPAADPADHAGGLRLLDKLRRRPANEKFLSRAADADPPGTPDIASNHDCIAPFLPHRLRHWHWPWPALLAGCAVGPAYERPTAPRRPPGSRRRPPKAGCPPRRPMRSTAASGGRCSATRRSTSWRRACRSRTRTSPPRSPTTRRPRRWCASSARRCSRSVTLDGSARRTGGPRHVGRRRASAAVAGRQLGAGRLGPPAPGGRQRAGQRAGQRGRPGRGAPVGRRATSPPTTSRCARPMPNCAPRRHASKATSAACRSRTTATTPASPRRATCCRPRPSYANTQADALALKRSARQLEHAIAVLVGVAPADFSLPVAAVEADGARRAGRRALDPAAAPARHRRGRARGGGGQRADRHRARGLLPEPQPERRHQHQRIASVGDLFNASNTLWSLGLSVAQMVFDAGAIGASVDAAKAGARGGGGALPPDRAGRLPERRGPAHRRRAAWRSRKRCAARPRPRPTAPSSSSSTATAPAIDYTNVVVAQVSALNARRTLLQVQANRQTAAVALIQSLGGGWHAEWMAPARAAGRGGRGAQVLTRAGRASCPRIQGAGGPLVGGMMKSGETEKR